MSSDTRRLLATVGLENFRYRELASRERVLRSLTRGSPEAAPLPVRPPSPEPDGRRVVVLVSGAPNAGRTTLAAALSVALARDGHACLVADVDPANRLQAHFGADELVGAVFGSSRGRRVPAGRPSMVAFGEPADAERAAAEGALVSDCLARRLEALAGIDTGVVLVNAPAGPSPWRAAALRAAQEALVLVPAGASSRQALDALLAECAGLPFELVITRFDARQPEHREAVRLLSALAPEDAPPFVVHEDGAALEDALAHRRPVADVAADSQLIEDVARLAARLGARLGS